MTDKWFSLERRRGTDPWCSVGVIADTEEAIREKLKAVRAQEEMGVEYRAVRIVMTSEPVKEGRGAHA